MIHAIQFPNDSGVQLIHTPKDDPEKFLSSFTAIFSHHKEEKPKGPGYLEDAHHPLFRGPGHQYVTIVLDSDAQPHRLLFHGEVVSTEIDWSLRPYLEEWLGTQDEDLVDEAVHALNVAWGYVYSEDSEESEEIQEGPIEGKEE